MNIKIVNPSGFNQDITLENYFIIIIMNYDRKNCELIF